jgi:hypothetical protein
MSPAQFEFMQRGGAYTTESSRKSSRETPARLPRPTRRRENLPENQVEEQIVGYLKALGWRVYRMSAGARQNAHGGWVSFGERGVADYAAWRPKWAGKGVDRCELLFVEVKAPGQKPKPHQLNWLAGARVSGAEATWVDSLDGFCRWYKGHFGRSPGDAPGIGL